jgi:hypothetical protein
LNVEDDLVAINNQIVIGWHLNHVHKYLEDLFCSSKTHQKEAQAQIIDSNNNMNVCLCLRKMPKDNLISLKQYRILEEHHLINNNRNNKIILNTSSKNDQFYNKNDASKASGNKMQQNQRKLSFSDIFIA